MVRYAAIILNFSCDYSRNNKITTWRWQIAWGETMKEDSMVLVRNYCSLSLIRGCTQKFPDWVDNEIHHRNNNSSSSSSKHSLRSNTKCYGGKTHYTDSQNSDITAPNGRELYHSQFSLQPASPGTFGYTLVCELANDLMWSFKNVKKVKVKLSLCFSWAPRH
jgi:hypothetical protein